MTGFLKKPEFGLTGLSGGGMGLAIEKRQNQGKKILWCLFITVVIVFSSFSSVYARGEKFFNLFHGNLSNRYRLKASGGVSDQDLLTLLTLDIGDSTYQKLTGALQPAACLT